MPTWILFLKSDDTLGPIRSSSSKITTVDSVQHNKPKEDPRPNPSPAHQKPSLSSGPIYHTGSETPKSDPIIRQRGY